MLCRSFTWWGAGKPSLELKFCIIELVGFCALEVVVCRSEGWGLLQVWVFVLRNAMFVDGVATGACGNLELLWVCVLSGDVYSPPGRSKELLGGGASFSSLMVWSEFWDYFRSDCV